MSRKFLTVVISLLILAGCSLSGVSRASRTAFAEEVQKLSASYPQPKDMSAEDWANESVLRAKKQLAMQSRNPDFLTLLAEEESLNVLTRVAKNPKTPLKILEKFSTSDVLIIRNYLAANTALSEKLLEQLSRDKEPDVRQAAAANPKETHTCTPSNQRRLPPHPEREKRPATNTTARTAPNTHQPPVPPHTPTH